MSQLTVSPVVQSLTVSESVQSLTIAAPTSSPAGAAGGDLQGTYPNPTVHKIHGVNMQSGTPTDGDLWQYHAANTRWRHRTFIDTLADNGVTAAGLAILDDADASAQRTTIGLGSTSPVTFGSLGYANGETIRDASLMVGPATATRDSVISGSNTSGSRIYYGTPIARSTGGSLVVTANTAYYLPIFIPTLDAIRNIRVVSNGTVTTGNCILGLYADNQGRPGSRLQQTASTSVSSGFGYTTVAVNWTPPKRGWHWVAAVFSSTPTMYSYDLNTTVAMQGVINFTATGRSCFGEREAVGSYALPSTAASRILDNTPIIVAEVSYTA